MHGTEKFLPSVLVSAIIAEREKVRDSIHHEAKINLNFPAEKHNIVTLKRFKHKKKSMLKTLIVLPLIFLIGNLATSEVYLYRASHIILIHTIKNRLQL